MANEWGDEPAANEWGDTLAPAVAAPRKRVDPAKFEQLFAGPEAFDKAIPADALATMKEALTGTDGTIGRMRAANTAFLADRFNKTPEEIAAMPDQYRASFAEQAGLGKEPLDDAAFYGKISGVLTKEREERGMLQEMTVSVFEALRTGKDFNSTFTAEKSTRGASAGWDASRQDFYRKFAQDQWEKLSAVREELEPAIEPVAAYMKAARNGGAEGEDISATLNASAAAALDALAKLTPEQAEMVMDFAAGQTANDDEGEKKRSFGEKLVGRVTRGTDELALGIVGTGRELIRRSKENDAENWDFLKGRAAGVSEERRRDQLERQLRQRIAGEVDPMKANGWIVEGVLAAAESVPRMVVSLTLPGLAANLAATKEDIRGQYEDAGMAPGQADALSAIAAVPYTALEFVQAKMVFGGKVPGLSKILTKPAKKVSELVARTAAVGSAELAEQFTQEVLQDMAAPAVQSVARVFSEEIPEVNWSKELASIRRSSPETLAALLPLVLVGTGTAAFSDRAYGREYLKRETYLQAFGIKEEDIAKILEAPTPEATAAAIEQAWPKREETATSTAAVEALNVEAVEARAEVTGATGAEGIQSESAKVAAKYPERFKGYDGGGGIPVEVQAADGTRYPALFNGYWEISADRVEMTIGRWLQSGEDMANFAWSHGFLHEGEKLITAVPAQADWAAGVREVTVEPAPAELDESTIEGENPNPTEPGEVEAITPPVIDDRDAAEAKTERQWNRIGGAIRKIDHKIRGLDESDNAGRNRLLLQRLEIQADAGIPGAAEALNRYHEAVQVQAQTPDVDAGIRKYLARRPLAIPSKELEGTMTMIGELKTFAQMLTPAQRSKALRKDGETDLDTYAADLVEFLQQEGLLPEGDSIAMASDLMGGEGGVLDRIALAFGTPREPVPIPRVDREIPGVRKTDRVAITRTEGGEYVVTDPAGMVVGTASSAEFAANIVQAHKGKIAKTAELPAEPVSPGEQLEERAAANSRMASPEPESSDRMDSVIPIGNANRATVHTKRAPGVVGSVSSPEVIDALAAVLEQGGQNAGMLRFGRVPKQLKAAGYYQPRARIIRVKTSNNIETAAHEVAHAIEDALFGIGKISLQSSKVRGPMFKEMMKLGRDLYGSRTPNGGYASEGFAEFFRLFVTDPAQAKQHAPEFFKEWTEAILPGRPELERAVMAAQKAGVTFYGQGSMERARQGIIQQPGRIEAIKEASETQLAAVRRKWTEAAAPIEDFVAEANKLGANVQKAADPFATLVARRLTADAVAGYMATEGMLDFAGNVVGKPLQDAFAMVKGKEEEFIIYLWAKRAAALWSDPNGERNPGLAKQDVIALLAELRSPSFDLAAQQVYDWNNGVLNYAAEASPDFAETVKKIRAVDPGFYIPLFREFSALDDRYTGRGGTGGKNLVKTLKGSGRRIKDPVESMLSAAKAMVLKSHQKAVLDQIIRIAETTPGLGHLVIEVPKDKVPTNVGALDAFNKAVELAEEKTGARVDGFTKQLIEQALDGEVLTFFMPAISPKQNESPVLPVFRNGETKWFEMDPELYKALSGMDLYRLPRALDLFLGIPARMFRIGTTGLRASFSLVTNPLRDLRTLMMNSQASANPAELFGHWMSSLRDVAMDTLSGGRFESEWSDLAERLGVQMAGTLTQDTRPLQVASRKIKRGGAWSIRDVKDSMDVIRQILQIPETASRLAEMKATAKDLGWDPSQPLTPEIAAALATRGKQVTTDFTQAGEYARVANQAIPFFNASIQGPVAHIRALKADPKRFVLRGLMGTAAALGVWWANKDEEWWKEMPTKERYLFTYIPIGDELIRIPRSYEVDGIFMALTEALADAWYQKEPRRMTEWFSQFAQGISQIDIVNGLPVPPLPVLPKLMAEQLSNRQFFYDRPLIPRGELENVRPEEQYSAFSTNVAIELGDLFNVSPRRIDHMITGIFGPVGGDIVSILGRGGDKVATDREWEAADLPVIGTLFQRGGQSPRSPESIEKLYDAYDEALKIQHSEREKETTKQRQIRLMLVDAVKTQTALSLLERAAPARERRAKLESLRIAVAKTAVAMAETGEVNRAPNRLVLGEAKRELLAIEKENPKP